MNQKMMHIACVLDAVSFAFLCFGLNLISMAKGSDLVDRTIRDNGIFDVKLGLAIFIAAKVFLVLAFKKK
jgi:hypothetical protein